MSGTSGRSATGFGFPAMPRKSGASAFDKRTRKRRKQLAKYKQRRNDSRRKREKE